MKSANSGTSRGRSQDRGIGPSLKRRADTSWMPEVREGFPRLPVTAAQPCHPRDHESLHDLSTVQNATSWVLQLVCGGILVRTLYFKFTAAEESVYIFTTLGV